MPLPQYRYGKATGLPVLLTVVSERAETPMVCCGYCSGHMAARTAKAGLSTSMTNEAHRMRAQGGRPHPAPSTASEIRAGASKAIGVELKSVAIADIPARLRLGYAIAFMCDYAKLPASLKVQSNAFVHDVCLYGWDEAHDYAGFFDPLWNQGAVGAWAPWKDISPAARPNGNHLTTTVRLAGGGGAGGTMSGDYVIYDDSVDSRTTGKVPKGSAFYNDWQLTQKRGGMGSSQDKYTVQMFGYRDKAYACQVLTAQGWSDGKARQTLVFFPASIFTDIVTAPVTTGGCTPEELLAAKQEGYDLAMSPFPPRPK